MSSKSKNNLATDITDHKQTDKNSDIIDATEYPGPTDIEKRITHKINVFAYYPWFFGFVGSSYLLYLVLGGLPHPWLCSQFWCVQVLLCILSECCVHP